MNSLGLSINGNLYEGWQEIAVNRGLAQLAHTFNVSFAERWNEESEPIPINEGDACLVKIDGETVMNGYVDDSPVSISANEHTATVSGRSKTADLVDCVAIAGAGQWRGVTLDTIARDLAAPFGLSVVVDIDVGGPFRKFALQESETVHEALARAARMRGVMLLTSTIGDLVLSGVGTRRVSTAIRQGVNLKSARRHASMRDRFSEYTIKAQAAGSDDFFGGNAAQIKRSVSDDRVTRYRPMQMLAENEDTGRELEKRIAWERNTRAGRARTVTATLVGWRDDAGDLWAPNTLVQVVSPFLRIDEELLITSVSLMRSEQVGTTTTLELMRKEAFDTIDFPTKRSATTGEDFFA